ncbi:Ent-kaurene oxidase [Neonectria ditissima]|uniref:Ent-kaurene oxidase n=1 Tax=Neonectria ditissima TaxID=78410 RepID=A0A0P7BGI6_9HYPO|nr:Ent-kaurene oxidase [Neonectria ditissima]
MAYTIKTTNITSWPEWVPFEPSQLEQIEPSVIGAITLGVLSFLYLGSIVNSLLFGVKAPFVGYRSFFEPTWLLRLRFVWSGPSIINEGYRLHKESLFQLRRIGTDILLLPSKYVEEIRTLTKDETRSVEPFIHDFVGDYTRGLVFLQSDLQNRVIQQKLTPYLSSLTAVMKTELDLALKLEVPSCEDEWVKVDLNFIFTRIIARISARVFLGPEQCYNEEWLSTTAEYSKNLFITGMILRLFPKVMRPFVAPLLPTYRALLSNVATGRRVVTSIVTSRRADEAQWGEQYARPTDILQWMMDSATGEEQLIENLSQRILILSLASIHTTALTMTQAMYDLCANPEHFEPLRQEVTEVLRREGGWKKTTLNYFLRLDSLLKESQRFNPVFLLTFNRIFHKPLKLSDGTVLPAGTRVAVAANAKLQDAAHVPGPAGPGEFDPFRYSRLREDPAHPENAQKHLFAMIDSNNMAFGYGKYGCPGRFYASNEMKLVLAHLLLLYDIKLQDGQGRPKNLSVDSDMFPDPAARVLIKKRGVADQAIRELVES